MRWLDRVLYLIPVAALVITSYGSLNVSPVHMDATPHLYPLATWEITHFMGKWFYKVRDVLPGDHRDTEGRRQDVLDFMAIADEVNQARSDVQRLAASALSAAEVGDAEARLRTLQDELASRGARVEEILESEISSVLGQQGFKSRIGIIFPPVDFAFDVTPNVLIVSPRDRIETVNSVLLTSEMDLTEIGALESRVETKHQVSALVDGTGGVSFYPSVMSNTYGLLGTLSVASHEWLHQYLFFHPLGRNYFSSPEMAALNETLANLAGEEIGDLVYEAITGEKIVRQEPTETPRAEPPPDVFDFGREMRKTRLRVDELLAAGQIDEAEAYMEERRQEFVAEGYYIRKLNQAYFAFHGTYADTPASVSPIYGELKKVRANSASVGDFIRSVASFGSYEEFKAYVEGLPG